jgi:ABC-type arginine/histidine transport system permease subunit
MLCDAILGLPAGKLEATRIYGITGFEILPSNVTPLAFPMVLPA